MNSFNSLFQSSHIRIFFSKDNFVIQWARKCLAKIANKNVKGKFFANLFFFFVNYLYWIFLKAHLIEYFWQSCQFSHQCCWLAFLSEGKSGPSLILWFENVFWDLFFYISFERKRYMLVITRLPSKTWQIIIEHYWFWINRKILIAFSQKNILMIWCTVLWSQTRRDMVSKYIPEF